ncbi:MAG: hypothetical protein RLZZ367_1178 [Bacteroidota bacterium]
MPNIEKLTITPATNCIDTHQITIAEQFYFSAVAPVQVKNSYNSIGQIDASLHPSTLQLKLSVTQQALRYFVLSASHQQVIFYGDYTLHHVANSAELAERIEQLYNKDEVLQLNYGSVLVAFDEKYTLVPAEFTFMIDRNTQLSQTCGTTEIVYECPEVVLQTIKKLFRNAQPAHLASTYYHQLKNYLHDNNDQLFVNVGAGYLDIIRFDTNGQLHIMNRYNYQSATDLIYFVLLCCDELQLDRETTSLVLLGEVTTGSQIYDLCYRYFRNLSFIHEPEGVQFSNEFAVFPRHLHFNLYNLSI